MAVTPHGLALVVIAVILALVGLAFNFGYVPSLNTNGNPASCTATSYQENVTPQGAPFCYTWSITPPTQYGPTQYNPWIVSISGYIWPADEISYTCKCVGGFTPEISLTGAQMTINTTPVQTLNLSKNSGPNQFISPSCIKSGGTNSLGGPNLASCSFNIIQLFNLTSPSKSGIYNATLSISYTVLYCPATGCFAWGYSTVVQPGIKLTVYSTESGYGPWDIPSFSTKVSGTSVTVTDTSQYAHGNISTPKWTFGDGGTGTGLSTTHSYHSAGQYEITESYVFTNSSGNGLGAPYAVTTAMSVTINATANSTSSNSTTYYSSGNGGNNGPSHGFEWPPNVLAFGTWALAGSLLVVGLAPQIQNKWGVVVILVVTLIGFGLGVAANAQSLGLGILAAPPPALKFAIGRLTG